MKLTILVLDNFISIDDEVQKFNLVPLIGSDIWSIHFDDISGVGTIEYVDINTPNETIIDISPYQPIIDMFNARKTSVLTATQIDFVNVVVTYESNETVTMSTADADSASISYVALSVDDAIALKKNELKEAFSANGLLPVSVDSVLWNGGQDSSMAINNKIISLEFAGSYSGNLYDTSNNEHALTVTEMKNISSSISAAYEVLFAKFQQKKNNIALCGSDTVCISNITW